MMIYYQLISNSPTEEEIERVLEKRPEGLSMSQKEQQPLFKEIKRQQKTVDVKSADYRRRTTTPTNISKEGGVIPGLVTTFRIYNNDIWQCRQKNGYNNDYIVNILNELPQQWIGKEMKMQIIADIMDAAWIARRVLEDVERGLINAQFTVKESDHLCDMTFVLRISEGLAGFRTAVTAIIPVLSFPLTDIKSKAIFRGLC